MTGCVPAKRASQEIAGPARFSIVVDRLRSSWRTRIRFGAGLAADELAWMKALIERALAG